MEKCARATALIPTFSKFDTYILPPIAWNLLCQVLNLSLFKQVLKLLEDHKV